MGAYVEMDATINNPSGYVVYRSEVRIGDVTYGIPIGFVKVSDHPVVFVRPKIVPNGRVAEIQFDSWWVVNPEAGRELPAAAKDMDLAVRLAREFNADPAVSWSSTDEDMKAWLMAFIERYEAGDR